MSSEVLHKVSEQRSRNMSAIKSKNTKPEIAVRKVLHSMGYRFRLHGKDLPGSPDIAASSDCCHFGVIVCVMHLQISTLKTEKWTRNRTSTSDEFI